MGDGLLAMIIVASGFAAGWAVLSGPSRRQGRRRWSGYDGSGDGGDGFGWFDGHGHAADHGGSGDSGGSGGGGGGGDVD